MKVLFKFLSYAMLGLLPTVLVVAIGKATFRVREELGRGDTELLVQRE